jgi:mRNA-degrading endonuclease toxin of MazEF toxin-antitoxin module
VRRGDIWRYNPVIIREGQPTARLIVSADPLLESPDIPTVYVAHIVDTDPGSLLAVQVGGLGWAVMTRIDRPPRGRLVEQLGAASADEMEQVGTALRATFEL